MGAPNCPHPKKKGYKQYRQAQKQVYLLFRKSKDPNRFQIYSYRCQCGKFHVGHRRKKLAK